MDTDKISVKMAKQLDLVVERASEIFVDLLENNAREGKISIGPITESDKRNMELLFSNVVNGQIVAEAAAIVSFLIYTELQDNNILNRVMPTFMDKYEDGLEHVTESMVKKTSGVVELARSELDSGVEKSEVVTSLLHAIVGVAKERTMRTTFNAVMLSLFGE